MLQLLLNYVKGSAPIVYIVRPGLWAITGYVAYWLPAQRPAGSAKVVRGAVGVGLFAGSLQVAVSVLFGLFEGFGRSPYSFHVAGLLVNAWTLSCHILGEELSRAWLVNRLAGRRKPALVIPIALAFPLLSLPLSGIPPFSDRVAILRFLGRDALPAISNSLARSVMAYAGGPLPAIAYRGVLSLFWWFSPIIPDLSWSAVALIDTVVPVLGVFIAHTEYVSAGRSRTRLRDSRKDALSTIVAALTGMLMVWFSLGLFPVYPSVIVTGSMQPYATVMSHRVNDAEIVDALLTLV